MWAHCADKLQSMVIGIDVEAAGLTDEKTNLIPAQFGSVIYVSRWVTGPFTRQPTTSLAVGAPYHFPVEHYEKFQRVFLHKPLTWAYEEERVLKSLHRMQDGTAMTASGSFTVALTQKRMLHRYNVPVGSMREVYFGIRSDLDAAEKVATHLKEISSSVSVFESVLDEGALSVGSQPYRPLLKMKNAEI